MQVKANWIPCYRCLPSATASLPRHPRARQVLRGGRNESKLPQLITSMPTKLQRCLQNSKQHLHEQPSMTIFANLGCLCTFEYFPVALVNEGTICSTVAPVMSVGFQSCRSYVDPFKATSCQSLAVKVTPSLLYAHFVRLQHSFLAPCLATPW